MNQYREGKVKSTPMRGVKKNLKPYVYKQWKLCVIFDGRATAYLLHNESATYVSSLG